MLFPAAGLDPAKAAAYYETPGARRSSSSYAGNEAARRYLNGEIDRAAAASWLERYALMPRDRAEQRVRFFDQYRSYVINYNLGKDLVRRYIESRGGTRRQAGAALEGVREAAVVAAAAVEPEADTEPEAMMRTNPRHIAPGVMFLRTMVPTST